MSTQLLVKKIEKLEKALIAFKQPKDIMGKVRVDGKILKQAERALFKFDIEKFVSKKDLRSWK